MTRIVPPARMPRLAREHLLGAAYNSVAGTGGSNGAYPDVVVVLALAEAVNSLAGRGKVIPAHAIALAQAPNVDGANADARNFRLRTSGNSAQLLARIACAPSTSTSAAHRPSYSFNAGVTERYWDARAASPVEADARSTTGARWEVVHAISPNTVYTPAIVTDDFLRLVGWTLWEQPVDYLDTALSDVMLTYGSWVGGRPITATEVDDLCDVIRTLWQQWQKHLIAHVVDDPATPLTRTTASYANIFDQALVAYAADRPGWVLDLGSCNALSETTVPVTCAVYASGTAGKVKFETATASAVISPITGAAAWYEATLNADPTDADVQVFFQGDGAAACTVSAVSAWVYRT